VCRDRNAVAFRDKDLDVVSPLELLVERLQVCQKHRREAMVRRGVGQKLRNQR
jgi:hypothetical protein